MAAKSNSIFKITQLAKDLGLKPKELTEKLEALGIGVKNTSAELEAEEVNFLFASLSDEAAIKDIEGYLGGKTEITLPDNKAEEKAAAEKAAAEKAAAERIAAEKAAAEKAEAERIAAEKAAAEKAEAERIAKEKAEAERIAAEKAAAEKAAKEKAEAERIAAEKAEAERIAAEKAAAEKAAAEKAAAERAAKEKADAEKAAQNKQSQQGAGMDNRSNKPSNKDTNKTQQSRQGSDRGAFQKNDSRPAQANRPSGERRFDQKDSRGGFDSRNGDKNDRNNDRNPVPRAPKPVVEQGVEKKRTGGVRVVDTRSSNVDLSKYDERLENIAPEIDDAHTTKQKVKKQNTRDTQQRQGGKKNNKENLAMERMKKANLEKAKKQPLKVTIPDEITVGELAQRLKITAADCIKRLMLMGVMATVNQVIDYDTAYLIADEMGAVVTREVKVTIEDKLFSEEPENEEDLEIRAPVVCVMGHVDHGKTSILDAIRHTNVTSGEAGGITQHIGAYRVTVNGRDITFLDTPGHEAFTAMRARGAQCTDIAILVVAGDDGIMPQTVEAINHAKAAGVDIIVAINKMDKPHANAETVKAELAKYELIPEEWGGDVMCVPVSALTKMGINDLLEDILLIADVKEYKANPHKRAKGVVIEAKLDKGRGPVATVLVQDGTLKAGDIVIAGTSVGHVRAMVNDKGENLEEAGPSVPVEIIGLSEVPLAGDEFNAVEDERMARTLADQRREKAKEEMFKLNAKVSLDDLFSQIKAGVKELNVIVKADVGGSAEAVKQSLEKISNDEVKVRVISAAVGGITESDVMFAAASNAIIIGFNVRPDKSALDSAERQKVEIRTYRIIYECIEEVKAAMKGMLAPTYKENLLGHCEVRATIKVPNVGVIAGSYVLDGKVTRQSQIRIVRDGIVIMEDKISSLRRFKDDVKEVAQGYECGIGLEKCLDIREGDILEAYVMEEVKA